MTLKCECGYEFTTAKATTSVQKLSEKIEEINALGDKEGCSVAEREKRICDAIEMFSVPNTKEDILEFLTLAVSNIKKSVGTVSILTTILSFVAKIYTLGLAKTKPSESDAIIQTRRRKAWRSKFDQVMMKARSLRGDAEFQKQLDYFENLLKK